MSYRIYDKIYHNHRIINNWLFYIWTVIIGEVILTYLLGEGINPAYASNPFVRGFFISLFVVYPLWPLGIKFYKDLKRNKLKMLPPSENPDLKDLYSKTEPELYLSILEDDLSDNRDKLEFRDCIITNNYILSKPDLDFWVVPLEDIIWAYSHKYVYRLNWIIPLYKHSKVILHIARQNKGKLEFKTIDFFTRDEFEANLILAKLAERCPHALFGYFEGLEEIWKTDPLKATKMIYSYLQH